MGKWEMVRLGDVCRPKQWKTIAATDLTDKGYPIYGANGKIGFYNKYTHEKPTILVTCRGATCGAVNICESYSYVNGNAMALDDLIDSVDLGFLSNYLTMRGFTDVITGSAQPQIIRSNIEKIEIPLPPLVVQQQIADVLDRAGALIEKRKAQIDKLDLLVKSQFIEMFGDPVTNPKGWEIGTIRDFVSDVKYGTSKPASENGKHIYLRMNNITYEGSMDFSSLKYIDIDETEIEKYAVRKGDVLFNRTNSKELVGKTAVFKEDTQMIIAGYIIRVRTNEKAHPEFISAFLNSQYGKNVLLDMCKAIVGQANINAQELQDIKIPLTPIAIQNEFADFVHRVEVQKSLLQQSLIKLEQNYKSLMQKCFNEEVF